LIQVDTSVWVDFLNDARGSVGDQLEHLNATNGPLVLMCLVVAEVFQSLKREVESATRLLVHWPLIEPSGFATYEAAATIFRQALGRGVTLSTEDALLAAVALEYHAALFTLDRVFGRLAFSGLRLHWRS
jgi:predicted nucleic acid-binding protein